MAISSRKKLLIESLSVWAVAVFLAHFLYRFGNVSFISQYSALLTALVFLYLPVIVLRLKKQSYDFFEKNLSEVWTSFKYFVVSSLLIFPVFLILGHYFLLWVFHAHYHAVPLTSFPLWTIFLYHLFLVALPEEFFFRGYLLGNLKEAFPEKKKLLGIYVGKAFFLTALIFAFSHSLVVLRWWHFSIFFPALAFGWLRERTKGLVAPILFHALSNVCAAWISMHYR